MIRPEIFSNKWPVVHLSEAVEFLDSRRKPVKAFDRVEGAYPYYGANGQQGTINDYIFDERLVLLAEDGGHFGIPGRKIAYTIFGKTWVNNHAHVLKPKNQIDLNFLCRQLEFYDVTRYITGSTRGKLTKADASRIQVCLPPIEEQRRIAAILDKADAIRKKREQALALADDFLRATFLDMFGDFGVNPKALPEVEIGDVVSEVRDGPHVSPEYADEGIPILSTRNIRPATLVLEDLKYVTQDNYDFLTRVFKPQKGDVLLTKGGTTGFAKAVDFHWPFAIWVHLACLRPTKEVLPSFLETALNTKWCYEQSQKYTRGITNKDLGLTRIKKIKILLPPKSLQLAFEKTYSRRIALKKKLNAEVILSEKLVASLSQRAFRGEL